MTAQFWEMIIGCLPPKTRSSVKRVLLATRYAVEKHPRQPIGPQAVYDAWLDLHSQAVKGTLDPERNDLFTLDASMGTVSQYLDLAIAYHQSSQETAASYAGAAADQEPALQQALDSVKAGVDHVGGLIVNQKRRVEAEQRERFQSVLDQQLAAADERARQAEKDKDAYRLVAEERRQLSEQVDALRDRMVAVEGERDAAVAQAQATAHAHEISRARLTAAEAQIAAMQKSEAILSAEVSRLQGECQRLAADAERCAELRTEIAVSRHQVAHLELEVDRLETIVVETDKRHERERAGVAAARDQELAVERQRFADIEAQLLDLIGANGARR